MLPPRLTAAILLTLLALIAAVTLVSLARDQLDPVGVLTVLSTMFSGFVAGLVFRSKNGSGNDAGGDPS